ncbi:MAG: GGDEF domain-containing protein [Campylobacterota bacterium]|nr:GGDEF domain-containing protein [Campylobacterota bacterium]
MKKDWSVIRITVLLYLIIFLLPLNYYFAKQSFQSTKNDATTMKHLVFINGAVQHLINIDNKGKLDSLTKEIDISFKYIDTTFINFSSNIEYIKLFRADESYNLLKSVYTKLKDTSTASDLKKNLATNFLKEINAFSHIVEDMMNYKQDIVLDRLYISLAVTMFTIITLIFFIRFYIKLQLRKHAIHDHVTGLYNKKYFDSVLNNAKLLADRQEKPLAILLLSITNYKELRMSLDTKTFEKQIQEFAKIFSYFFRQSDTVCRIDNACFAAITPDATLENANKLSKRLGEKLKVKEINININLEVTTGVSMYDNKNSTSLLEDAKVNMSNNKNITVGSVK